MNSPRARRGGATVAVVLAVAVGAATFAGGPVVSPDAAVPPAPAADAGRADYTVLLDRPAARDAGLAAVRAAGGDVVRENSAIDALVVQAPAAGFVERVAAADGVFGASRWHPVGATAVAPSGSAPSGSAQSGSAQAPPAGLDPLDAQRWSLPMMKADAARAQQPGDRRVLVGVLDTGIDASHPDLAPNVDLGLSRNFVTDVPTDPTGAVLDGPCEFDGCVDPAGHDDAGHGTHVAGIIAAAANGAGVSGVAPNVTLVSIRAGQDGGLFFLQPVVDALTYGADIGLDVINMSFYVDPWRFNCLDNAADSPEARISQRTTVEAVQRALEYAHSKGVTLVGSLGNENLDLGRPKIDSSSPNYPAGAVYSRPLDNASCFDLPVEGPHVIGVSAVGPGRQKAEYSNYGVEQVGVAAPGGAGSSPADQILSTYPEGALRQEGLVDAAGAVTPAGTARGAQRVCAAKGCAYYLPLSGTSMAAPQVSGVAALVVSQHGEPDPQHPGQLTMAPDEVERVLSDSAAGQACQVPTTPDAPCEGTPEFNGYYGHGIVDALAAVQQTGAR